MKPGDDSFGKPVDGAPVLFGYAGMQWDTTTGLYNDGARWYDAAVGRFVTQDPIGFAGGDANLYRYVGNSPTNFTIPRG